jgi:4-alpha-glucanotransferase
MLNFEDLAAATEQVNLPGPLVGYPCWRLRMDRRTREIIDAAWVRNMLARVTDERSTLRS